jgi:hypothetical protein
MTRTPNPILWLFAAAMLYCSSSSAGSASTAQGTKGVRADSRRDMIAALPAVGPHPSLGDQALIFDRFVGTWDCN